MTLKILLVESQEELRRRWQQIVYDVAKEWNLQVDIAESGKQADFLYKGSSPSPHHILITNSNVRDVGVYFLVSILQYTAREHHWHPPVVAILLGEGENDRFKDDLYVRDEADCLMATGPSRESLREILRQLEPLVREREQAA